MGHQERHAVALALAGASWAVLAQSPPIEFKGIPMGASVAQVQSTLPGVECRDTYCSSSPSKDASKTCKTEKGADGRDLPPNLRGLGVGMPDRDCYRRMLDALTFGNVAQGDFVARGNQAAHRHTTVHARAAHELLARDAHIVLRVQEDKWLHHEGLLGVWSVRPAAVNDLGGTGGEGGFVARKVDRQRRNLFHASLNGKAHARSGPYDGPRFGFLAIGKARRYGDD